MPGKKKATHSTLVSSINKLSRTFRPDQILAELSATYEEYSASSTTEAEVEYWLKCSRACKNLSSGTEKWLYEMADEEDDGEGDE